MHTDILIIGQGLAGTMLGWELERAGISFTIVDCGHAAAATMAAAGIINPITGRRLVKSWRIDTLLPQARAAYGEIERALNVALWQPMRVRRLFADDRERIVYGQKHAAGDLAPFAEGGDAHGFWIHGAARIDLQRLLAESRDHWRRGGRLRETAVSPQDVEEEHDLVIDCRGAVGARAGVFSSLPWEFSKGQMIEVRTAKLEPGVILNSRHWVLPVGSGEAWIGATHEPGVVDATPTAEAKAGLEASGAQLLRSELTVVGHRAGVRVNLPDRRPIAGLHPELPRQGIINGLGAKGALWAPLLAAQWKAHLVGGEPFDAEIDARRFS